MLLPRRETVRTRVHRFRLEEEAEEPVIQVVDDVLATEEPMEIRVTVPPGDQTHSAAHTHSVAVTMRTPGHDFELAAGFLFTEGLVTRRRSISRITYCSGDEPQEYNLVEVRLRGGAGFDPTALQRNFYMTSSCGICGKASLEAVENLGCVVFPEATPGNPGLQVDARVLQGIPHGLRAAQPVFGRTGGLHAAGLFNSAGELQSVREDVGRHNAVDKVVGHAFLEGRTPLSNSVLAVSGRTSFEILQKAVMAGIPIVVAVGAPSSLAVDFARRFRMTLTGFTRDGGFNVYAGRERILPAAAE
ncbi:MAG: formate dehydrogenase accessory sulfurtransferase FdhD [Gemmatimonadota bacterium]